MLVEGSSTPEDGLPGGSLEVVMASSERAKLGFTFLQHVVLAVDTAVKQYFDKVASLDKARKLEDHAQ